MFGVAPLGLHDDVQGAAWLRCNLQCSHFKPTFPPTRRNSSLWLLKLQLNDYMVSLTRHNWIYFTPVFSSVLWILSSFCLMGGKQLTAVLVSFNRRWHCQQHHQLFTVFHPTDFALLILRGEISFLHILRNNMGCAELLTLKEIRLVTCCTSFFFVKELTGTGSEKYLKVWRPSMLALDSACGAPQGKINVYILKKKHKKTVTP